MKSLIIAFLVFPLMAFASVKESMLVHLEDHIMRNEMNKARSVLYTWETEFPEDAPSINLVRCFLLLQEDKLHEAIEVFEQNIDKLESSHPYSGLISIVFYKCIEDHLLPIDINNHIYDNRPIVLCKRGWKIKSVLGCVLIGVGTITTPFAPSVGATMITSGVGMVTDGVIGAIEDDDERKEQEKRNEREYQPLFVPFFKERELIYV